MVIVFDCKEFVDMFKSMKELVSEARLCFDKGTLTITEMDPANVCLFHKEIEYKGKLKKCEYAVNVGMVFYMLKKVKSKEIKVTFTKKDKDDLMNLKTDVGVFSIVCVDVDDFKEVKIPNLDFTVMFDMEYKEFQDIIINCDKVCESVNFIVKKGNLYFEAKGDYGKYISKKFKVEDSIDCNSKYSLDYLKKFNFVGNPDKIRVEFAKDYPLKISFVRDNYILAPRLESD